MVTNEIVIDERLCHGCGYCVEFCPTHCLEIPIDNISPKGYYQPALTKPEKCTGCGVCVWMCPHWAIVVNSCSEDQGKAVTREQVAGPPRLAVDPPFAGCSGCQHPTVGRIVAEVVDELGVAEKAIVLDAIPCATSSAFGLDFGRKLTYDENATDLATYVRRNTPNAIVAAVQGYWGLADFSLDVGSLIGALIRGENITLVLCNMPYYAPKEGRPSPVSEPAQGRLEPATRINTPEGTKLIMGGHPLHIAELAAGFKGVAYSARGAITSVADYQTTKGYIRNAFKSQMNNAGLSIVEVLCVCGDLSYSVPVESLNWVKKRMTAEFPLGEFKTTS
ncbi:4Fe-4S binding protein [Chloroflexota bacterium]